MQDEIPISKFKATCLQLLDKVHRTGKPLLITRRGKPIAMVVPPPPKKKKSWTGTLKDSVRITGDIISPVFDVQEWEVLRD